jgi:hypothetical protein
MKFAFWFCIQLLTETFLILRTERDIITYIRLQIKYPSFSSDFHETWKPSTGVRIILKYQIPWISVCWELICSVRTDMTSMFAVFPTRLKFDSHELEPTLTTTTNFALSRRLGRKSRTLHLSSREGTWRICLSHCWSKKFCGTGLHWTGPVFRCHVTTRPAHPVPQWLTVRYLCTGSNVPCPPDSLRTSWYIYCK